MSSKLRLPNGTKITLSKAKKIVTKYSIDSSTAIEFYDRTQSVTPGPIAPLDILCLGALNAFGNAPLKVMDELWQQRHKLQPLIDAIPTEEIAALESAGALANAQAKVIEALEELCGIPQWGGGGTRAAKFLHRQRPNIAPVWDRFVGDWYSGPNEQWSSFVPRIHRDVLDNLDQLATIRNQVLPGLHLLRVWDILLWSLDSPEAV